MGYSGNEASSNTVMTSANGFEFFTTPMFVNCPNVGPVDKTVLNDKKKDSFTTSISTSEETVWLLGSAPSLIFNADMPITFFAEDGTEIGSTTTNLMGAFEYELDVSMIPEGSSIVKIMFKDELLRTVPVTSGDAEESGVMRMSPSLVAGVLTFLMALLG